MEEQPLVGVGLSRFGSFRNLSETGSTLEMEPETHKIPNLLNLGDALATILLMVPLEQR